MALGSRSSSTVAHSVDQLGISVYGVQLLPSLDGGSTKEAICDTFELVRSREIGDAQVDVA